MSKTRPQPKPITEAFLRSTEGIFFGHVIRKGNVTTTTFMDGAESSNWPPDTQEYAETAAQCGFLRSELGDYNWEHELCHHLVCAILFESASHVVWKQAHKQPLSPFASRAEELLVYYLQRFIHDPCYPVPSADGRWDIMRKIMINDYGTRAGLCRREDDPLC